MSGHLSWLQKWYQSNCDSDWEHIYGIKIDTLDNPGWSLAIDLDATSVSEKDFRNFQIERTADDWISCKVEHKQFQAACGPLNLTEVIGIFRAWVTGTSG